MQKICSKCIQDSGFPGITFDSNGICSLCHKYEKVDKKYALTEANNVNFSRLIEKIKSRGKNNEYDSIIGVSGGRDSSYCLYLMRKWGLNPLAVHYDNNMNSKIAAENIKNSCRKLDIDLFTFVVDWEEFKDLQKSFLKASVPSVDIPSDHAFVTVLYEYAYKNNIKYIFNGSSFRTEGPIPPEWSLHNDTKFILDIQKKWGTIPLKKYPIRKVSDLIKYRISGMTVVLPLYHMHYAHAEIMPVLEKELGWQYYGGHHFESIFTRWAFAYYLPKKFGIDTRIPDYSALIRSGQMSREEAVQKMKESIYSSDQEKEDRRYIMNKLELNEDELDAIINSPLRKNFDYAHHLNYIRMLYTFLGPRHV
ncbi:MAG: N-acetyl sugar amidotransferase [Methanoregula sp.]